MLHDPDGDAVTKVLNSCRTVQHSIHHIASIMPNNDSIAYGDQHDFTLLAFQRSSKTSGQLTPEQAAHFASYKPLLDSG